MNYAECLEASCEIFLYFQLGQGTETCYSAVPNSDVQSTRLDLPWSSSWLWMIKLSLWFQIWYSLTRKMLDIVFVCRYWSMGKEQRERETSIVWRRCRTYDTQTTATSCQISQHLVCLRSPWPGDWLLPRVITVVSYTAGSASNVCWVRCALLCF